MWARMSEAELVRTSDLIVVGEWIGQSQAAGVQSAGDLGVVAVSEVLKGTAGTKLAFVAVRAEGQPVSSSDLSYKRGDRGLWFLRLRRAGEAGIYLADHPQRFVREGAEAAAQVDALRRQLRLR